MSFELRFWRPRAWLEVRGEDAASFLQGQCTADLRGVRAGEPAVYALWLSVKGKVLADSWIWLDEAGVWQVLSEAVSADALRQRIESFIVADDVEVSERPLKGWIAESHYAGDYASCAARKTPGSLALPGRGGAEVAVLLGCDEDFPPSPEVAPAAGQTLLAEWTRVTSGAPLVPVDIGPGDLPQEAGLEARAVSFTKGCYVGQEVMARLHAMGQVRRRLLRVHGTGDAPASGAGLWQGGRQVAELRSVAPASDAPVWAAWAMTSLVHANTQAPASLAPDGPAEVKWEPAL